MPKSNENLSLDKSVKLYGVEIKKMPCGKYFNALQTLKDLPQDFIEVITEGKEDFKLSEMMTPEGLAELIIKLIMVLPDFTISFISKITDIDEKVLKDELSPTELLEVCKKFYEINKLESFFAQMKPIVDKILTQIGFKK